MALRLKYKVFSTRTIIFLWEEAKNYYLGLRVLLQPFRDRLLIPLHPLDISLRPFDRLLDGSAQVFGMLLREAFQLIHASFGHHFGRVPDYTVQTTKGRCKTKKEELSQYLFYPFDLLNLLILQSIPILANKTERQ